MNQKTRVRVTAASKSTSHFRTSLDKNGEFTHWEYDKGIHVAQIFDN
jgi:hypothetical protein